MLFQRNTTEFQDACELWELFEETKGVLLTGVFGQPASVAASDETWVGFLADLSKCTHIFCWIICTNIPGQILILKFICSPPVQESVDETDLPANPETGSLVGFEEDSLPQPEKKEEVCLVVLFYI